MDQRSIFLIALHQEPWIDRKAVSAHAQSRAQDVDPRMAVGQRDQLMHIDACDGADLAELIGKGDIDVPVSVFHQLAHLRGHIITSQTVPFLDKGLI